MSPGPPPTPSKLRQLRGNPGRRPRKRTKEPEPEPSAEVPEPLRGIGRPASRVWRRVAPELHAVGLLTPLDYTAFAAWCTTVARWHEAEREVRELGPIVKSPTGYPIQNPYL
ncbi:MAG: P27 family phage terminase small subunit, partial [Planctomycetota bacterium]